MRLQGVYTVKIKGGQLLENIRPQRGHFTWRATMRKGPSRNVSLANESLVTFLEQLMRRRDRLPGQLAADLGVSHATVSRWLSGKDRPNTESCRRLAAYAAEPLKRVLSIVGHLPALPDSGPTEWPEFREYAKRKYGRELDDDLIATIEDLIERRRGRNGSLS